MTSTVAISFSLNGRAESLDIPANLTLVDLLRHHFGMLGNKVACDQGACGACTVLADGEPLTACLTFAFTCHGKEITTIEGIATGQTLSVVQAAFHKAGVPQCGFCTPGMVLLAHALLRNTARPSPTEIDSWMSANICRCGGYQAMRRALAQVAEPRC